MELSSNPMRLASIQTDRGLAAAVILGQQVFEIAAVTGRYEDNSMLRVISDWQETRARLRLALNTHTSEGRKLQDVKLAAPIGDPGGIYCAGANYSDH
ncbi:MAG: 2-keto-4-pentenoate hydratase, partial [Hyphomicrobiales bacterium]|nr:2-keto-4-pentenoate hydratase [Hyphomicrobiales bacterium]